MKKIENWEIPTLIWAATVALSYTLHSLGIYIVLAGL